MVSCVCSVRVGISHVTEHEGSDLAAVQCLLWRVACQQSDTYDGPLAVEWCCWMDLGCGGVQRCQDRWHGSDTAEVGADDGTVKMSLSICCYTGVLSDVHSSWLTFQALKMSWIWTAVLATSTGAHLLQLSSWLCLIIVQVQFSSSPIHGPLNLEGDYFRSSFSDHGALASPELSPIAEKCRGLSMLFVSVHCLQM